MPQSKVSGSVAAEPPYDAVLAAICHGTHVCAFFETEDDLLDLVGQFFAAGTRRGDRCLWVMPDNMNADPLVRRGVELYSATDTYLRGGAFEPGPLVALWDKKLDEALSHNHAGLSASGHTCWLQQRDWQAFMDYEEYLNQVIEGKPISLLCTYPLSSCKAGDILDVVRAHKVALAKQKNRWSVIEAHLTDESPAALDGASRVAALSPRERQVISLVADGVVTKNIAFELGLSVRTIEVHRERAIRRLGVRTMVEAVRLLTLASPSAPLMDVSCHAPGGPRRFNA
ncbi:MEDS domain-containing protein [Methylopila sp. 73B]|uniref:MEDS domain-containing protein n=1 Tax=Methylopila sp. 73B TaxID=1120792 RepID=UPI0009DF87DC|nr:MEDS domain-containing protein [Methylopila sp. 73B]